MQPLSRFVGTPKDCVQLVESRVIPHVGCISLLVNVSKAMPTAVPLSTLCSYPKSSCEAEENATRQFTCLT